MNRGLDKVRASWNETWDIENYSAILSSITTLPLITGLLYRLFSLSLGPSTSDSLI